MNSNVARVEDGRAKNKRNYIFKDGSFADGITPKTNTLTLKNGSLFVNGVCQLLIDYISKSQNEYVFIKYNVTSTDCGLYFSSHSSSYTAGTIYKQDGFITQRHLGTIQNAITAMPADKYILIGNFVGNIVDKIEITEIFTQDMVISIYGDVVVPVEYELVSGEIDYTETNNNPDIIPIVLNSFIATSGKNIAVNYGENQLHYIAKNQASDIMSGRSYVSVLPFYNFDYTQVKKETITVTGSPYDMKVKVVQWLQKKVVE